MGPLANPAHVTRQLIGIARPDYAPIYAEALAQLGPGGRGPQVGELLAPLLLEPRTTELVRVVDELCGGSRVEASQRLPRGAGHHRAQVLRLDGGRDRTVDDPLGRVRVGTAIPGTAHEVAHDRGRRPRPVELGARPSPPHA